MKLIKVLIVDDSKLVREILGEIMAKYADVEVVGAAKDAFEAREMIKQRNPDVITLDVEMPKMNGITFLKNLMRLRPMPVVMLSTLTLKGADTTLEALESGAVDFIAKPRSSELLGDLTEFNYELHQKIQLASTVNIQPNKARQQETQCQFSSSDINLKHQIIALGASTGGTEALKDVLSMLPINSPAVVVTQHIPESFSGRFAKRLNDYCKLSVHEANHGQIILPGNIYIAPGSQHLTIDYINNQYRCKLSDEAPRNRHKPSVDVMFDSLLRLTTANVYAGLLTGMGNDGAKGLLKLKEQGHYTLVQDEKTSMIWGMPGTAFRLNAHWHDVPLTKIASMLLKKISQGTANNRGIRTLDESLK